MRVSGAVLLCVLVLGTPARLASHSVPSKVIVEGLPAPRPIPATLRPILRWKPLADEVWPGHSSLLLAVIAQESRGIPDTYVEDANTSWDAGLLGINSENWPTYGLTWQTAIDPSANMAAGVAILKECLREYENIPHALECYNGGPAGVGADWLYPLEVTRWQKTIRHVEEGRE